MGGYSGSHAHQNILHAGQLAVTFLPFGTDAIPACREILAVLMDGRKVARLPSLFVVIKAHYKKRGGMIGEGDSLAETKPGELLPRSTVPFPCIPSHFSLEELCQLLV